MKYLIIWVGQDNKLKWDIKISKKQAEAFIESFLGERLAYYKDNIHDLVEIVEIEPNFEFLDFNVALITTVKPSVVIK